MVQKLIGFYGGSQAYAHFNKDNFFIEVSNHHYCCWVRTEKNNSIAALEVFTIDEQLGFDWSDIFYEIGKQSVLVDKSYNLVTLFYNTNENVLIPAYKFNAANADGYLDLLFGANENCVIKYDSIDFGGEAMYNVYRINATLGTMIKTNFLTITEFHTYTGLLKHLTIDTNKQQGNCINLYFYNNTFIAIILKNNKLQIAQSFIYNTPEDILYYCLNFTETYKIAKDADPLFVSGIVEQNGAILNLLKQHFASVYIAYPNANEIAFDNNSEYPTHYFTPFFNLQV